RNLRYKGETYIVTPDPKVKPTQKLLVKRLQVGDNWNPEPGGWPRLAAILHNKPYEIAMDVQPAKIEPAELSGAKIIDLTGTGPFKLTDEQRKTIKDFVDGGGTLIVDAAGGSNEFADAAEAELKAIFGDEATKALGEPLAADSAVYHLPNADISQVRYRLFARKVLVGDLKVPRVKAISIKGRLAVFYSREDLSAGLVGEPVNGILGYEPQSATEIMRNLVLYSSGIKLKTPAPASKPAKK